MQRGLKLRFWFFTTALILIFIPKHVDADSSTTTYKVDDMNRYTQVGGQSIGYDGRGNVIHDGANNYVYDLLNRQTAVTPPSSTTVEYLYDALGRRIGKRENGQVTRYIYDTRAQVLEETQTGILQSRFTYGSRIDDPITVEQGGQTYYYHQDGLGSIAEITDANTNIVERYTYTSYGEATIEDANGVVLSTSIINNPYQFTGRRYDPESGNLYYRARLYKADWGKFLQRDSVDAGMLGQGVQGHNRYTYVSNNPINYTDSSGHTSEGFGSRFNDAMQRGMDSLRDTVPTRQDVENYRNRNIRTVIDRVNGLFGTPSELRNTELHRDRNQNNYVPFPQPEMGQETFRNPNAKNDFGTRTFHRDHRGCNWRYEGRGGTLNYHPNLNTYRFEGGCSNPDDNDLFEGSQATYDDDGNVVDEGGDQGTYDFCNSMPCHQQNDINPHVLDSNYTPCVSNVYSAPGYGNVNPYAPNSQCGREFDPPRDNHQSLNGCKT